MLGVRWSGGPRHPTIVAPPDLVPQIEASRSARSPGTRRSSPRLTGWRHCGARCPRRRCPPIPRDSASQQVPFWRIPEERGLKHGSAPRPPLPDIARSPHGGRLGGPGNGSLRRRDRSESHERPLGNRRGASGERRASRGARDHPCLIESSWKRCCTGRTVDEVVLPLRRWSRQSSVISRRNSRLSKPREPSSGPKRTIVSFCSGRT